MSPLRVRIPSLRNINRITVEFKSVKLIAHNFLQIILIESQWNLNNNTWGNDVRESVILIESQWNLN